MMKKLIFILFVSVLFYACGGSPERGNYIPKSAQSVVVINMKGIVDEIKWDILFSGDLFEFKTSEEDQLLVQLLKDPTKSGVEFMDKAYVFHDSAGYDVVIVPLSDGEVLGEFLSNNGDTIKTEGDFQYANTPGTTVFWNDKTAFLVNGQAQSAAHLATYLSNLIEMDKSGLFSTEFKGKALLTGNDHISYWMKMPVAFAAQHEQIELSGAINFKNGKMQGSGDFYFDEKGALIKAFQKQSTLKNLAAATDVNKSTLSLGLSADMSLLNQYLDQSGAKNNINGMMYMMGVNVDFSEFLKQLDGNLFVSVDGFQIKMEEKEDWEVDESGEYEMEKMIAPAYYLTITTGVSVVDTAQANKMVKRTLYNFAAVSDKGVYSFGPGKGFLLFKESDVFYTTDSAALSTLMNSAATPNATLSEASLFLALNFKDVSKKISISELHGPDGESMAKKLEASIEGIKVIGKPLKGNVLHVDFELNGVNKEENILLSILKLMKAMDAESPEA